MRAIAYVTAFVVFMLGVGQLTTGRRTLLLGVVPFAIAAIAPQASDRRRSRRPRSTGSST